MGLLTVNTSDTFPTHFKISKYVNFARHFIFDE